MVSSFPRLYQWRISVAVSFIAIAALLIVINESTIKTFTSLLRSSRVITCDLDPEIQTIESKWLSSSPDSNLNFTSHLISRMFEPNICSQGKTVNVSVPKLDETSPIELLAGETHEFEFRAVNESGKPICSGGDYFEWDLSGEKWKSRPLVKDFGNGSYSVSFQVHPDFPGRYNLTLNLLFRNFEGLRFSPERFAFNKTLRNFEVLFRESDVKLSDIRVCEKSDFDLDVWSGRWTRHGDTYNFCDISDDGKFRCLPPEFPCPDKWCNGSLGVLESNGWVYSNHCVFKLFQADSAWNCLKNRWIFFWGDSNHVDTIRNMLNFVLQISDITSVPRRFDMNFTNPNNPSESVRITSIFNGHWNETQNYQGLNSLQDEGFRSLLKKYFEEEKTVPDTIIMNSGLHDGVHWRGIRGFILGAEYAAMFWKKVLESVRERGLKAPKVIYRNTVATGGYARSLAFNPHKMDIFNTVLLEKLRAAGIVTGVIDNFDMTYPWHFDNRCNDGVHYGRAPSKSVWKDGEIGHQYFVDLMLVHVLLNALCAR